MGLLKRRPEVQLYAPRVLIPGQTFQVRVVVACERAVPVEFIDLELRGTAVHRPETQYGSAESEIHLLRLHARVHQAGELAPGRHAWQVEFRLPSDAPPSYGGASLSVYYRFRVHASVPWWPDTRAEFVAHVLSAPAIDDEPAAPRVFVTDADARGRAPFFELSLGSTIVTADARLQGALALVGTRDNAYRQATLAIVAVERVRGLLGLTHHHRLCRWTLPVRELGDGEPLRFSLRLPAGLAAGFERAGVSLSWYLHARVEVAWARDPEVWIPLTIVGRRHADDGEVPTPLAVGSERLDLLWRAVAAECEMSYEPGIIHGTAGASQLRISREPTGRGAVVVARVETPDLGVGLALRGDPPRLVGRDAAQVGWLERQLAGCFARRRPAAASDRGLVFELDGGGRSAATLRPFVDDVKAAALRLEQLREQIPAPVAMAAAVPAWERAAERLAGRLQRASMTLVGRVDDVELTVRTAWDDRGLPRHTVLELRPALPVDARHHLTWRDGDPLATELPLARLRPGARALEVTADAVRVVVDAPLADPLDELDRLVGLAALGHQLAGRRGLYR